jgi:hypothetical protein
VPRVEFRSTSHPDALGLSAFGGASVQPEAVSKAIGSTFFGESLDVLFLASTTAAGMDIQRAGVHRSEADVLL